MLCLKSSRLKLLFLVVSFNFQIVYFCELQVYEFFCCENVNSFSHLLAVTSIRIFQISFTSFKVRQVIVKKRCDEVMLNIVKRSSGPTSCLQFLSVQLVEVILKVNITFRFRFPEILLELHKQIIVPSLLVLDERLVLKSRFKVHHGVTNQLLHLERIEIRLIGQYIPNSGLSVFNLSELDV